MKVFQINGGSTGSTGTILFALQDVAGRQGIHVTCASPITTTNRSGGEFVKIGSFWGRRLSELMARITGLAGCFSPFATARLLRTMRRKGVDLIHLHTLHSSYINLPMLFRYIKKRNIPVVWTLHDCWAFTGHCPHFAYVGCDKWRTQCGSCLLYRQYPASFFDNSSYMYRLKKRWFTGVSNMVLVTPSQWLSQLVESSFLKDHPSLIIRHGIDLSIFKPTPSDFRVKHAIDERKHILLGVAFGWSDKKGLDVFIELAKRLDGQQYQIVLVGTDEATDKLLPENIISIHRTFDQRELAQIYSAADLMVNPTREEMLGLVNLEANACGTPVVTFRTGGSPECIDENSGCVVECNDTKALEAEIIRICTHRPYSRQACVENAARFEKGACFSRYIQLYKELAEAQKM